MSDFQKTEGDLVVFRNTRKNNAGDPDRTGFFYYNGEDHNVSLSFNPSSGTNDKAPTHTGTVDINAKAAQIAVFVNKEHEAGGRRPNYKSKFTIGQQNFWGGIWENVSKKGVEYWSGKTDMDKPSENNSTYNKPKDTKQKTAEDFDMDDDLPF